MRDHRFFLDGDFGTGGYQSERTGVNKDAHDAWMKSNTWNLSRDDFIKLSYFKGCLENGSDGKNPGPYYDRDHGRDAVYISPTGGVITRSMAHEWFVDSNAFMHGYMKAIKEQQEK